ncbi:MAG: hypothetical protein FWB76_01405 [Oscillospiraceae bacterium]|nr:hypothetical protein [Oscillospiraceae bacterium]
MAENKFEKQRQKDKAKFEKERAQWQKKDAKARNKKKAKFDVTRVVFTVIAVVVVGALVLSLGGVFAVTYGIPARWMPVITVAGTSIRQPEYIVLMENEFQNAHAHARQLYEFGQQLAALGLNIGDHFGLDPWASPIGQPVLEAESQVPVLDAQGNPVLDATGTPMFTSHRERVLDDDGNPMYWEDQLAANTNFNFHAQIVMYNEARRLGLTLTDLQATQLEARMNQERAQASGIAASLNAFLRLQTQLPGYTARVLERSIERSMMVSNFHEYQQEVLADSFSDADVRTFVDEDSTLFDFVDVRIQPFVVEQVTREEGESDEDFATRQAQAAEDTRQQAAAFLAGVSDEASFIAAAQAILDADVDPEDEDDVALDAATSTDFLRHRRQHFDQNFSVQRDGEEEPDRLADWLYDPARSNGDTVVFEQNNIVHAVMLVRTAHAIYAVDFYTLRLPVTPATPEQPEDDAEWDAAAAAVLAHEAAVAETLAQADALLAQFEENGGNSAAFRALGQPGLLTGALPGSESFEHAESEQWLFEHARQVGDAVILPILNQAGAIGEVILVFLDNVQQDVPNWLVEGRQILTRDAFDDHIDELLARYPIREHRLGMWFVRNTISPRMDWFVLSERQAFLHEQQMQADGRF